jgi:predicted nuclease of predicted toxin-antitoxin system
MPRSLKSEIAALGFVVEDVRDVGLRGRRDNEILAAAVASDSIIITRDRGFTFEKRWPTGFSAGVIFVNLPDTTSAASINSKVTELLSKRIPVSLLGAVTYVEQHRALSRSVRRRS